MRSTTSMHIKNKGFTLIELLVVIAIIGLLASVILASLRSAREKGDDATIKSSINNARVQAALYFDTKGNTYDPTPAGVNPAPDGWVCTDPKIVEIQGAVDNVGGTFSCSANATQYRISSLLVAPATVTYYCVDYTGKSILTGSTPGGTLCP